MASTKKNAAKRATSKKTSSKSRTRQKPGSTGQGKYYHIEVRPTGDFETFRTQDVGDPGHVQRVAGKRVSGSWATVKWLIDKDDAHVTNGHLVPDTKDAKALIAELGSKPSHIKGDRFEARPRRNVAERDKPTAAQRRAQSANVKKGRAARRSNRSAKNEIGRLV